MRSRQESFKVTPCLFSRGWQVRDTYRSGWEGFVSLTPCGEVSGRDYGSLEAMGGRV